jgi:hypothetical protein
MRNEREDSVWFIHAGNDGDAKKSETDTKAEVMKAVKDAFGRPVMNAQEKLEFCDAIMADNDTGWVSTTSNLYTKDDHATSGVNRKFDATLVDTIDEVYRRNWDLPEYLPFRECVKMGIQDGIQAGMKRASAKYDKVIADKNKQIIELEAEAKRWRDAFKGLLNKCQQGVEALDFISRVIHGSCGKKY